MEKLNQAVDRLHALLSDPQPGLATWNQEVGRSWERLARMWYLGADRIDNPAYDLKVEVLHIEAGVPRKEATS